MNRLLGRFAAGVAVLLVASTPVVVATTVSPAAAAPATCPPDNPPARVLSFHASDVVPGATPRRGYTPQQMSATAENPCQGGCPIDVPTMCSQTAVLVKAQRTGTSSTCVHHRESDGGNLEMVEPGIYHYSFTEYWTDNDADDDLTSPRLSNKCAGAYDVAVTIRNDRQVNGQYVSTLSAPFLQSRSFTVRRPSRLTTNAGPEPVRVGRTVTVQGRLTRANWDAYGNPQVAYAGQRVLLQRRTATGSYHTLGSDRTNRRGHLSTGVKALRGTRCYRWVFPENATTQGRAAGGDCVRAR